MSFEEKLKEKIYKAVSSATPEKKKFGIAFSGGVDSSLLAKVCKDLGKDVLLLTVGLKGSHDLKTAIEASKQIGLPLVTYEINEKEIASDMEKVSRICSKARFQDLEICAVYYYVFKLASKKGLKTVVNASGIDELFCGYEKFCRIFGKGEEAIKNLIQKEVGVALESKKLKDKIAATFGVKNLEPFLEKNFVEFALSVPIEFCIKSFDDKLRKHIVREIALKVDLPNDVAMKQKKAMQYGSGMHSVLKKILE
jgi:asparagine synthase (glutamine-hydrolysing)